MFKSQMSKVGNKTEQVKEVDVCVPDAASSWDG